MHERVPFDIAAYERRTREGPCFVCAIARGEPEYRGPSHIIYEDDDVLVFLNWYPTLPGYTLVCPRRHVERVVGDLTLDEYLLMQTWIYRVGRAIEQVVPTERLYILSIGSQQGNRHVHWHVAACPPGLAYADQQFAALMMSRGILDIPPDKMTDLASKIRGHVISQLGPAPERAGPG